MSFIKKNLTGKAVKRTVSFFLMLLMLVSPVITSSDTRTSLFGVTALAAEYTYTYYSRYTGSSSSLVDALKAVGADSSYSNRGVIASLNGISNYSGTSSQNNQLLALLKAGKLIKSKTTTSSSNTNSAYYAKYTGSSDSLVDALKTLGIESSFINRQRIADANGISNYSGTSSQNTKLLSLLKKGTLKKAGSSATSTTSSPNSDSSVSSKISSFLNDFRFKEGTSWGYYQQPKVSSYAGIGCCAYTADYVKVVFGKNSPRSGTQYSKASEIRMGDVVVMKNTQHWFIVISRSGNTIKVAEGNYNSRVAINSYTISGNSILRSNGSAYKTFDTGYHYC